MPPEPTANQDSFAAGARAGLPVVLGYLGIGFAAGVVERAGLTVAVCAGLVAVAMQSTRPGPLAVLIAALLGATLGLALERWTSARKSSR